MSGPLVAAPRPSCLTVSDISACGARRFPARSYPTRGLAQDTRPFRDSTKSRQRGARCTSRPPMPSEPTESGDFPRSRTGFRRPRYRVPSSTRFVKTSIPSRRHVFEAIALVVLVVFSFSRTGATLIRLACRSRSWDLRAVSSWVLDQHDDHVRLASHRHVVDDAIVVVEGGATQDRSRHEPATATCRRWTSCRPVVHALILALCSSVVPRGIRPNLSQFWLTTHGLVFALGVQP